LIVLRNHRTVKKTGHTTTESHYYLSSLLPEHYRPAQWLQLIRGHWAGVEIRNHWRRDALMGEDSSRSRNAHLLANMALLRSTLLALLADRYPDQSLPQITEELNRRPSRSLNLLCS
jgi:predicted transposase YbfD/YdcC